MAKGELIKKHMELCATENEGVALIERLILENTEYELNSYGRSRVRKWLREFTLEQVANATLKAFDYYYDGTKDGWHKAFYKISGICYTEQQKSLKG